MSNEAHISIDLARWVVDQIGKVGPISFNTGVVDHLMHNDLDEETMKLLKKKQTIKLGQRNKLVDVDDICAFLTKVEEFTNKDEFNASSYFFEGIASTGENQYE